MAGHFAGVGDSDLLDLAARDESVRRLLVDVAVVEAEVVEAEVIGAEALAQAQARAGAASGAASGAVTSRDGVVPATAGRRPLSPAVRARALAAFAGAGARRTRAGIAASAPVDSAAVSSSSDVGPALSRVGPALSRVGPALVGPALVGQSGALVAPRRGFRWGRAAIAAAVLLVPSVGLAVSSRRVEAASLPLEGYDRVGAGGDVETGGPRRLAIGQRVEARPGERVALRLVGGTRVVLADRTQMAVGCDAPCDGGCGGAVFEVESGAVVVAAAEGPTVSPVALRVRATGRVDVWSGAARVDRDGTGAVSLSLRSDARVRWSPEGGSARELVGPAVLVLGASGRGDVPAAAIDAMAFRDLEFFGGPLRRMGDEVRVGCRRWRILEEGAAAPSGPARSSAGAGGRLARARRSEMGGAPAIRFDLEGGDVGRAAWPADAQAYGARRVEVRFRALPAASLSGPEGAPPPEGARRAIRVRLEGVAGAEGLVTLADAPADPSAPGATGSPNGPGAPRLLRALLPLPASFRDAPPSGLADLVLSWSAEGGSSTVWFESVVFLDVGAADGRAR